MFQTTILLYNHHNVLHRPFAFLFLHPIKIYSAAIQIVTSLFFLMEVSVKNIYSTPKKRSGGGLVKNNGQKHGVSMSST